MDGVNNSGPVGPTDQIRENLAANRPPAGKPMGAPDVEPDVAVAISDMAQARIDHLMGPKSSDSSSTMQLSGDSGGISFGVDRGGFAWPLDSNSETTANPGTSQSMAGWEAAERSVNGVYVDEAQASESAYIALGKSTVNASE